MRTVTYSRVSTDVQERDGTSLDTQERACADFARDHGWEIVRSIRDTESGATLERPGMTELRRMIREGEADMVVAYAVDRLSRSQNHIGVLFDEFEQAAVRFEFVSERFEDTAVGRFILAARAFIAEVEREKIAERTMRGKAERARTGRIPQGTGRGCYGYHYNRETGQREIVPEQAEIVRRIFESFDLGHSLLGIVNRLNAEGVLTLSGKQWYPPTAYHILQNEAYTGRTIYRRTQVVKVRDGRSGRAKKRVVERDADEWIEIPEATPQIITPELFDRVQARLADPERRRAAQKKHSYGLSGHVKCDVCKRAMVGQTLQGQYRYYRCRRAFAGPRVDRCSTKYVRADRLEGSIRDGLATRLADPNIVFEEIRRRIDRREPPLGTERKRLDALAAQRERLLRMYQLGEIDDAYFDRELGTVKAQQQVLERRLEAAAPMLDDLPTADDLSETCRAVEQWVVNADGEMELLADALRIEVSATSERAVVGAWLPYSAPECNLAHVRAMVAKDSLV